jgi:hypothetical protein
MHKNTAWRTGMRGRNGICQAGQRREKLMTTARVAVRYVTDLLSSTIDAAPSGLICMQRQRDCLTGWLNRSSVAATQDEVDIEVCYGSRLTAAHTGFIARGDVILYRMARPSVSSRLLADAGHLAVVSLAFR